jgi:hypothetical protein
MALEDLIGLGLELSSEEEPSPKTRSMEDVPRTLSDRLLGPGALIPSRKFPGQQEFIHQADLPTSAPSEVSPPLIQNLKQLAQIAQATRFLPPELRQLVIGRYLGIPIQQLMKRNTPESRLQEILLREQLLRQRQAPGLALRQKQLGLQEQGLKARQESASQLTKLREQAAQRRDEALALNRDRALTQIATSIMNLTRRMNESLDPAEQVKLGQLIARQEALYQKLSGIGKAQAPEEEGGSEEPSAVQEEY